MGKFKQKKETKKLRRKLYGMRRVAGKISFRSENLVTGDYEVTETKNRVSWCGFRTNVGENAGAFIVKGRDTGEIFASGVMQCGCIWRCPVCSFKITKQRQLEVYDILQHYQKQKRYMSFVTLTLAHKKSHTLKSSLDLLLSEFRKLQRTNKFKDIRASYIGMIKSLEITYGSNGWHPHLHILFIHNELVGKYCREIVAKKICRLWYERPAIQERGTTLINQKQVEVYTSKDAGDYLTKWDASSELTKKMSKEPRKKTVGGKGGERVQYKGGSTPFGLLADVWSRDKKLSDIYGLYEEYVRATRGRANVIISPNILKEMKATYPTWRQKRDDEILKDEFIDKVLFKVTPRFWYQLFVSNKVVDMTDSYKKNGLQGVYDFFNKEGYNYKEHKEDRDIGILKWGSKKERSKKVSYVEFDIPYVEWKKK